MEDPVKDQHPSFAVAEKAGKSKLRYPLRSSTSKLRTDKSPPPAEKSASAHKRARASSSVSKSVSVLNLSAKEKSAKPPRRLSIPPQSAVSPRRKPTSSVAPISETKLRRSLTSHGRSDTPLSDASRSSARRKFNVLSSTSYWLSQIKLSESAPNHNVSLGFFKLALEAGCEPIQRLRDELKSYVRRHNVTELEETIKSLLEIYSISETLEQLKISETDHSVPRDGAFSSNEAVHESASPIDARNLKPRSLNAEARHVSSGKEPPSKENAAKRTSDTKTRASVTRKLANPKHAAENGAQSLQKKTQRVSKKSSGNVQDKIKQEKKEATEAPAKLSKTEVVEENKENMDAQPADEIGVTEGN